MEESRKGIMIIFAEESKIGGRHNQKMPEDFHIYRCRLQN